MLLLRLWKPLWTACQGCRSGSVRLLESLTPQQMINPEIPPDALVAAMSWADILAPANCSVSTRLYRRHPVRSLSSILQSLHHSPTLRRRHLATWGRQAIQWLQKSCPEAGPRGMEFGLLQLASFYCGIVGSGVDQSRCSVSSTEERDFLGTWATFNHHLFFYFSFFPKMWILYIIQ